MIVPPFRLSQTPDTVTLAITARYIKLNELEFIIEGDKVLFYCKPYHLKLCLPGTLQDELIHSKYDINAGVLTFVMKKAIPGEHFKNLDMIIRFLSPVNEKKKVDRVLILDDEQNVLWEDTAETAYKYGFAMKGLYDFHRVIDEYAGVIKVDPRKSDILERTRLQEVDEQIKFNIDHYNADYFEEESVIKELIDLKSPWVEFSKNAMSFNETEIDILKDLPNKSYNLSPEQKGYCYTSLIDILFAYCYDCRVTSFEGNSESGWTIVEIAASLSWLTGFDNVKCAVTSAFRRSLIYPLFRNFSLSQKVFEDVKTILNLGEVCVMKCLIHIYNIFLEGDCCRYILNDIFIKDYIIYVGKWNEHEWNSVVKQVMNLKIEKKDLNMCLEEIERQFLRSILQKDQLDSDDEPDEEEGAVALPDNLRRVFGEKLDAIEETRKLWEPQEMKLVSGFGKLSIDLNDDSDNGQGKILEDGDN
ncbi:hypothetical protein HHI36_022904 [Cryptolaemus montrouzieri]|uniref:Protein SHQ1 homolog n=1 Tax=Cryptolaemus montrouzieri TaxID=559131 RepID=A0ABD2PFD2_9CUCU